MLGNSTGRTLKTSRTSLRVLELVLEHDGLTLAELDALVDAPKSSLHAHLTTLRDCRYLTQDGDRYEVAFRLGLLGERVKRRHSVVGTVEDVVDDLAERTGEEANFSVVEHGRLLLVHGSSEQTTHEKNIGFRTEYHLHNTAAGKAILAELDPDYVEEIVNEWGLPRETEATITDERRLLKVLDETRRRGYGVVDEEFAPGLVAIGAVVSDGTDIIGGLSVGGPKYRIDTTQLRNQLAEPLFDAVDTIERKLAEQKSST